MIAMLLASLIRGSFLAWLLLTSPTPNFKPLWPCLEQA